MEHSTETRIALLEQELANTRQSLAKTQEQVSRHDQVLHMASGGKRLVMQLLGVLVSITVLAGGVWASVKYLVQLGAGK